MNALSDCVVLIVDDTEFNIDILVDALGDLYEIAVAMDGESALSTVKQTKPDLILLDVMMPGMDGYEVCKRLKSNPETADIPIIFLTAMTEIADKTKGFSLGASDYMSKPFDISEVKARVHVHLSLQLARRALQQQNLVLEDKVQERTKELSLTQDVIIEAMARLAEYRDPETGDHIVRTKTYVLRLAQMLASHPKFHDYFKTHSCENIAKSAILHDIGKVGVRDEVLLKPSKLTAEEFEAIKKHTTYGYNVIHKARAGLGQDSFLNIAEEIVYSHHEKWDGSGYPQGLAGENIPVAARLMAIADVYDALIFQRVYKPAFTHEKACRIIMSEKGKHFDPDICDAFWEINDEFHQIAKNFSPSDEELSLIETITNELA